MATAQPGERAVVEALRAGRVAEARAMLADMADPPPMLLAHACARAGDVEGEIAALASILAREPRQLQALLAMGEAQQKAGDRRAATSFFRTALAQAGVSAVPPALHPLLERARTHVAENSDHFSTHLEARIGDVASASPRVRHAVDLVLGRVTLYLQQPNMFYFPGLPQRYFYERAEFPWAAEMESRTPALRAELEAALADDVGFTPYVQTSAARPPANNPLRDDPRWSSFYFLRDGEVVAEHAARCPATMDALTLPDLARVPGRGPLAIWSMLRPGTHIEPHTGLLNTRLICHLPLIVPPGCGFRCGSEQRAWEEGKLLIFDDSVEHEAWNRGSALRVVLLFDIWRPELSAEERAAVSVILSAIEGLDLSQG
ncbi:aspartyl/asparaginyl beta-hydroxylase domain-containing protein [Sphingobium lignivorans]|uniref:Aspartyl/asparaginyl beta-hydroxylase (Cupin superfamily) n=1 Tax=Sphingobium lignivorans TaxID=2735886 RepID=A0ABR6NGR6_9SPHN|nr:aspartyl/asparaginyl beta-hydroxylase domain-containing protein [Sphingobium lignivorans]MBB5985374.1 aspartyl/asparaginyl beta-hydroxylase (cupin superfamily) [Sphingobium lignivorans]